MIFGVIAAGIAILSGALSYKAAKDAQKQAKKAAESMAGVLVNKESNIEPLPVIYGERRVGGTRVFVHTQGGKKNEYLYIALALCEGEVESISDIEIDDYPITDPRFETLTVTPGTYGEIITSSLLSIQTFNGSDAQTASSILSETSKWDSTHQLNGVAYIAIRLKWDEDVFSGIPDITAVVKGRKVYDPRTDTTAWSNNPALCIRDYLTDERYGKGLPETAINDTLFGDAAYDIESFIVTPYSGGSNLQIFQCNAVLDTGEEIFRNVERLLLGCRGFLPYSDGQYGLVIDQSKTSSLTIDAEKIIGGISIQGEEKKEKFNRVLVQFPNPSTDWQPDQAIWPDAGSAEETQFLSEDGDTLLVDEIDIETITNYYAARDFARIFCLRSRNALRCSLQVTSEAINLVVGDVVSVTHPTPGWTAKPFQVEEMMLNYDGTVALNLIEYDSTIYAYDASSEETTYPDTDLPDPLTVESPTVLIVVPGAEVLEDGSINAYVSLAWTASDDALVNRYDVVVFSDGGDENYYLSVDGTTARVNGLVAGNDYTVNVRAINSAGNRSGALSDTFTAVGDSVAPGVPTGISVQGNFKSIDLFWTNATDSDLSYVEVKESTTEVEGDAVVIGKSGGDSFRVSFSNGEFTRYYWLRSVDTSGNPSAWVSAGVGTTILLGVGDFADGVIDFDFIDGDFQTLLNGFETSITNLNVQKADQTDVTGIINEQQQIGDTLDTVAERMLGLATTQSETLGKISDAGITVDPSTGAVTIQAVETLRTEVDTRVNQVEIDLDAAEASIELKASVTYVNDQIAAAVLDSADLASLEALQAQVNQAEIDIDGNTASILLKADQTTLDNLDVRVTSAEIDIDGLQASITLKANTTDLTNVEDRVTTAEIQLNALDAASIQQTVVDTITLRRDLDLSAVNSLQDLLTQYNTREALRTDIAFARETLTADVTDNRESIAQSRTELLAAIDDNTAAIVQEQTTRASEDAAISTEIVQLDSRLTTAEGDITGNATAVTNLDARVTTAEGEITSQSSQITQLQSDLSGVSSDVSGNAAAITSLTTRVTAAEGEITVQASDITSLESSLTTTDGNVAGNATAITGLDTRVTAAEGDITAQASDITSLQSSLTTTNTNVSGNATAISGLDTRVTAAESDITAQASLITSLSTTVGTNTTSITSAQTSIDGIEAQYSVSIDNNGHVSGYALISEGLGQGDVPTSAFIINADQFAIGGTGTASDSYPFVVYPSGATVNGVAIPAGAYIDSAFINYLSATEIKSGVLNLGNQSGMAVRQGKASYTTAGTGFWLGNDGGVPKFIIGSGNDYFAVNGGSISARGITILDSAGGTVFDANEVDGAYIKDATIDTAQIAAAAITEAKIDDLSVSTLKIQNNAVTIPQAASGNGDISKSITYPLGSKPNAILVTAYCMVSIGGLSNNYYTASITVSCGSKSKTESVIGQQGSKVTLMLTILIDEDDMGSTSSTIYLTTGGGTFINYGSSAMLILGAKK